MQLDLTDEEIAALARLLTNTIDADRYPLSPRIQTLKGLLAKIRPEPPRGPLPTRATARDYGKTTARWALTLDGRQQHYERQQPDHYLQGPIRAVRRSPVFGSAAEPIGSGIVAPGEIQQFALGIRKPALGRDAAEPVR